MQNQAGLFHHQDSGKSCPNCGGELIARPRRLVTQLANNPPSTHRGHKPQGCRNPED
ncbi:DUF1272 domain-containing protein [Stutzerimonas xanthomarina]|uniref:DUF1272 domain-containing protein n=1 Tax=Stutzerimonas xanthomarina TaxID=271420 RepID=UPI003AA8E119